MTLHPDPELEEGPPERNVLLCDLGQGKVIADSAASATGKEVGSTKYRDPEITKRSEYTKETDIYALGIFTLDILRNSASSVPAGSPELVPKKLWEMYERCTSKGCSQRPDARKLAYELATIKDDEFRKGIYDFVDLRNVTENWIARNRKISSDNFSSIPSSGDF